MQTKLNAILWDKQVRLEGVLIMEKEQLNFQSEKPRSSGLNLVIPKSHIVSIDEYLLFGIERKGIAIKSANNRVDKFIVTDPATVKKKLIAWWKG